MPTGHLTSIRTHFIANCQKLKPRRFHSFTKTKKVFCETGHERQFKVYLDRFPTFIDHFPSEEAAKEAWKYHVYSTTREINLICLMRYEQSLIAEQVFRFMVLEHVNSIPVVDNDLLYCGKFVNAGRTDKA